MRTSELRDFGVPCAEFDSSGRMIELSAAAADILAADVGAFTVQAGRVVTELVGRGLRDRNSRTSDSIEVPSTIPGILLRTQLVRTRESTRVAVVVLLPHRRTATDVATGAWGLSPREREVAARTARGASVKEIAYELGITIHTVRRHTERIFAKLGVQSRSQLSALWFEGRAVNSATSMREDL